MTRFLTIQWAIGEHCPIDHTWIRIGTGGARNASQHQHGDRYTRQGQWLQIAWFFHSIPAALANGLWGYRTPIGKLSEIATVGRPKRPWQGCYQVRENQLTDSSRHLVRRASDQAGLTH